jgi:RHS repeat-associated protein
MYAVGDGWYYYHYDGLGSVVALSDSSGNIVEQCGYDAFGEPSCISDVGNPYKFTGRRYDAETGLYYYRARYYSPEIGRLLQPDPVRYLAGLNMYIYCQNNPTNLVDPNGKFWGCIIGGAIGGLIGGITGGIEGGLKGAISGALGGAVTGALIGAGVPPTVAGAAGGAVGAAVNAAMNGKLLTIEGGAQVAVGAAGGAISGAVFPDGGVTTGVGVGMMSGSASIMTDAAAVAGEALKNMTEKHCKGLRDAGDE